jgi:hypothetical protein
MFSDESMGRRRAKNSRLQTNLPFLEATMNNSKQRVLGRILAVEETRDVSGARPIISTIVDMDDVETSPQSDISTVTSDQTDPIGDSGTVQDTGAFSDSGTVEDTGILLDCASSGTRRDICLSPAD